MNNIESKDYLMKAFPPMPESYEEKVGQALDKMSDTKRKRKRGTIWKITAGVCAALLAGSICLFSITPVYAADIPVINELVYAVSPAVTPNGDIEQNIIQLTQDTLNDFYGNGLMSTGVRFKSGDSWVLNENTLMAAYYLQYQAAMLELNHDKDQPRAGHIAIKQIDAEQKAFRYKATIQYDITVNGKVCKRETMTITLEDSISGLMITQMAAKGADFEAYHKAIMAYAQSNPGKNLKDEITYYNAYLVGSAITDKNIQQQQANDPQQTTDEQAWENMATELRYQCYLARKTQEIPDLEKWVIRNEDTELLFSEAMIQAEAAKKGLIATPANVERGSAKILKQREENGLITVDLNVITQINGGVGEQVTLTLKKEGDSYKVVAYDMNCDGFYHSLKYKAKSFMEKGFNKSEANAKALESEMERLNGKKTD